MKKLLINFLALVITFGCLVITSSAKYEAFSKKALEECHHYIALLYSAISASENIHTLNHQTLTAEITNNHIASLSITYAIETEKKHNFFFIQVMEDINRNFLNNLPTKCFIYTGLEKIKQ